MGEVGGVSSSGSRSMTLAGGAVTDPSLRPQTRSVDAQPDCGATGMRCGVRLPCHASERSWLPGVQLSDAEELDLARARAEVTRPSHPPESMLASRNRDDEIAIQWDRAD